MHDGRKGIHRVAVDEHFHLHQLLGTEAVVLIVHAAVAAGDAFELIVEVHEDLIQRERAGEHHAVSVQRLRVLQDAALFRHQLHDVADALIGDQDEGPHHRLADFQDGSRVRHVGRVINFKFLPVGQADLIDHAGVGGDNVHVILPAQTLHDDLHVQQPEEAAAESEAQRRAALLLEAERAVIDLELAHRQLEMLKVIAAHRIDATEDHRLDLLEARQRLLRHARGFHDRVADLHLRGALQIGHHIAHVARLQQVRLPLLRCEDAHLLHLVAVIGGVHRDVRPALQRSAHHAHIHDHATIGIEHTVKHRGPQQPVLRHHRRRHPGDHRLQNILNADAHLGAREDRLLVGNGEDVLDLLIHRRQVSAGQVYLIDHGNNRQLLAHGEVMIGHRLRLHALRRIHKDHRALTSRQTPAHLVGKVHMPRRINEVQLIILPVLCAVDHRHRVALDGDAAFPFQVHGVEVLGGHLAHGHGARLLQKAVRERGFPVVNVGDDGEIAGVGSDRHSGGKLVGGGKRARD